jgi:hypothetical protein
LAGPDLLDQFREAGEQPRQQGEEQRDQEIRCRISGFLRPQILEEWKLVHGGSYTPAT